MDAVDPVIGRHHGPHMRLFHRGSECRQIDLVEGALIDVRVDAVPLKLLVVGVKVLHRRNDSLALHALDVGHAQPRCQVRILAVALKVTSPKRQPVDVYGGAEDHVAAQRLHFLGNRLALALYQFRVPGGCHRHTGRKAGGEHLLRRISQAGNG